MIPKAPLRRWAPWLILGMLALFPNLAAAQGNIATAPVNPAFLAWQKAREQEALRANAGLQPSAAEPDGGVRNYGYQPSPLDLSHIHGPVLTGSGRLARKDADFPASYDLRAEGQLTPIRDQGSFGTCWAHGALGALESSQLKAARGPFDLSEWHLAWFAYNNLSKRSAPLP